MADEGLKALACEWINRHDEAMAPLLARLLELKRLKTYEQVMYDLATHQLRRHARDLEYVVHLLYLVDERPFPIVSLQPIVGIQQGHLYRTLDRAGVDFVAAQSSVIAVDEALYPWPGAVHIDPLTERVKIGGVDYAFTDPACPVVVTLDEETRTFILAHRGEGGRAGPPVPPPLPVRRRS